MPRPTQLIFSGEFKVLGEKLRVPGGKVKVPGGKLSVLDGKAKDTRNIPPRVAKVAKGLENS